MKTLISIIILSISPFIWSQETEYKYLLDISINGKDKAKELASNYFGDYKFSKIENGYSFDYDEFSIMFNYDSNSTKTSYIHSNNEFQQACYNYFLFSQYFIVDYQEDNDEDAIIQFSSGRIIVVLETNKETGNHLMMVSYTR